MSAAQAQPTSPGRSPTRSPTGAPTGPAEGPIAADPVFETEDERSETASLASSSTSLTESIFEYRRIHGRPYTQKTDYYGPNDEKQNEGLDLQHYAKTLFFDNKLFLAPIGNNPQRVLDLGTGTGIWAM
ncbi:SAM-dependent methyltransferase [Colletotrichum musicola]|uniref:SAM-dependent methyltransferase n=1 Tax=Colletotrichum musicola TaxID=2175873 RepID=A0A8H6MIR8_9PEZI|nr:SAM-dependent methyltransferase [Colletotrichum musicola]